MKDGCFYSVEGRYFQKRSNENAVLTTNPFPPLKKRNPKVEDSGAVIEGGKTPNFPKEEGLGEKHDETSISTSPVGNENYQAPPSPRVEIDRSDSRSPSHVTRRADQGGHQIPNQATAVPGETVLNREEVVHLPINPDLKPKIPTPSPNRDVVNSDKEDTSRSKSALASGNSRQGRHEGHCSPNSKSQESLTPDTKEIVSHQNQPPPAQLAVGPTRSSKDKKEKGNKGHLTPDTKESVKPKTSTPRFPAPNLTPPFGNGPPSSDPSLIHDESSRNRISPGGPGAEGGGSQSPPNRDAKKHGTKDKSRHHTPSPQGKQGTGNTAPKPPSPPQPPNRISPAQPGEGSGAKGGKRLPPLPRGASSPGAVVTNHSGSHPPQEISIVKDLLPSVQLEAAKIRKKKESKGIPHLTLRKVLSQKHRPLVFRHQI
eukprot:GHVP01041347.1.p1 GENE.GHVP01041347.1~~GHVP01041347.1.p1  ORF type:complete len:486 (-),score=96.15 GHVP01041347.1:986-2266(-)